MEYINTKTENSEKPVNNLLNDQNSDNFEIINNFREEQLGSKSPKSNDTTSSFINDQ